jgi:hypothetical protein
LIHTQTYERRIDALSAGVRLERYDASAGPDFIFRVGDRAIKIELTTPNWAASKVKKYVDLGEVDFGLDNIATYLFPK